MDMNDEALTELGTITDDAKLREAISRCLYREMDIHISRTAVYERKG